MNRTILIYFISQISMPGRSLASSAIHPPTPRNTGTPADSPRSSLRCERRLVVKKLFVLHNLDASALVMKQPLLDESGIIRHHADLRDLKAGS